MANMKKIDQLIVNELIDNDELFIYFQPIVSISKKKMIGVEALARAFYHDNYISPDVLFQYAKKNNQIAYLDSLCSNIALETYSKNQQERLLFINFEASLIEEYILNFERLLFAVETYQIPTKNIAIEINEKGVKNLNLLIQFVELCRGKGFMIAMDDVCSGHSNLNRIAATKPDIVKIDRMAIEDINTDFYKQEITRAVVNLSKKIGAVTIAEGIETAEEASTCFHLGVDLCQGFYFSKAVPIDELSSLSFGKQFETFAYSFKKQLSQKMIHERKEIETYKNTITKLRDKLKEVSVQEYTSIIKQFAADTHIECIYILDREGYQLTDTLFNSDITVSNSQLFSPAVINTCHDLKQYYYYSLLKQPELFISDLYISLATGAICKTVSVAFNSSDASTHIICIDYFGYQI
jgi:EAL domain-containing protein (putative c-di-GMP-specific phosphodiesterase class I)